MSSAAIRRAIFATPCLTADEKLVALLLAECLPDAPSPSIPEISRAVALCVRTVQRALRSLERHEVVVSFPTPGRASRYELRGVVTPDTAYVSTDTGGSESTQASAPEMGSRHPDNSRILPLALDENPAKSGSGSLDRSSCGVAVAKLNPQRESGSKDLVGSARLPPTPVSVGIFDAESSPLRTRFVPSDWQPTDRQRTRMAELKWDPKKQRDVIGAFKVHEFQVPVSDWNRRFARWLEEQRMRDEAKRVR